MILTADQEKELAHFPAALRALIEAELAADNTVLEVGHSFPAPPAGAYFKLANKVSTRPRASVGGLDFYERNSSIYSGEFTDAKRFYFVLEAPNPPPPEPDMDAIRNANEPKPDSLAHFAQTREPHSGLETDAAFLRGHLTGPAIVPRRALSCIETATGAKRLLHFQDKRPPHELQFELERGLMTLFAAKMDNGKLCLLAKGDVNGARHFFELRFEAALLSRNCYSFRVEASWAEHAATHHDYFRKMSDSWFKLWTRDLTAMNPPDPGDGSLERYRMLAETALKSEANLDSVAAIQQAIVSGIKRGGTFSASHKEGGTKIFWRNGEYIRSDYGDYPGLKQFTDEAEFLEMLRQFCQCDVSRNAGKEKLSDFDTWKLILRLLHPR